MLVAAVLVLVVEVVVREVGWWLVEVAWCGSGGAERRLVLRPGKRRGEGTEGGGGESRGEKDQQGPQGKPAPRSAGGTHQASKEEAADPARGEGPGRGPAAPKSSQKGNAVVSRVAVPRGVGADLVDGLVQKSPGPARAGRG